MNMINKKTNESFLGDLFMSKFAVNDNIKNNNMTIVRNIAYSQINKINKKIKEEIEVDNTLLKRIDINMKNAINKIINDYKVGKQYV